MYRRNNAPRPLLPFLLTGLFVLPMASAKAQLVTNVFVRGGNLISTGYRALGPFQTGADSLVFDASQSYTGMDSTGNTQTMTLTGHGEALASYQSLGAKHTATVDNPYYNAANPLFVTEALTIDPAGSPDFLQVLSDAMATDAVTFTGGSGSGYTVQFTFTMEGTMSGSFFGQDTANLNFTYGSDKNDGTYTSFFSGSQSFVTAEHEIVWDTPVTITTEFYTQFFMHLGGVGTPPYTEGVQVTGEADFLHTASITGIQVFDPNHNIVSSVSLSGASGTRYLTAAVPEPGTMALLCGLGVSSLLAVRRMRRRNR